MKESLEAPFVTIISFLEEKFPGHPFAIKRQPSGMYCLYIDNRPVTVKYSHPDEVNMKIALGEVPEPFVTAEEYLKQDLVEKVTKHLNAIKE